jgi:hypothetical protein
LAGKRKRAADRKITARALRRDLKRAEKDLAKTRSLRDQAQARLEALEVLTGQLAAELDVAQAAEAWLAEGAAMAEAATEATDAVDASVGADGAGADIGDPPVPISGPTSRRRAPTGTTPPSESA